ncbi:neuronal acetylcholine receptor subunit eat-2-like [Convolutriloba macropyga]|uniref:neuronal acetylcholine receptor subunit eat-2-like n=1 Tax=Convolutriloba macropyga TaxID=536237 RepID=UPI003F5234B2
MFLTNKTMRFLDNSLSLYCLLFIVVGFPNMLTSTTSTDTRNGVTQQNNLLQRLQNSLPKYVPPDDMVDNTVHIFLDLYQISDVNEQQGVITVKLWLYYYYYSEEAKWNSSEFQRQALLVPKGTFWEADIVELDAIDIVHQSFDHQVVFGPTGLVAYRTSMSTIKFSCDFDVSMFPYDQQTCEFKFGPWAIDKKFYRLGPDSNIPLEIADLAYYKKHDEWELIEPVAISFGERAWRFNAVFDQMIVEVNLKREHLFYSVIFMLPNMLLYILSGLVYLVPPESGEKLSLAITVLLAAIVSFGTIADILPASSRNFPVVAIFVGIAVTQMTLGTMLTAVVINIHFMEGRSKMGYKLRRIVVSKYMTLFGLRACPMEKAFPGKKQWEEMNAKEEKGDKTIKADVTKSTVKDNWTKITDSSQNSLVSGMIFMKKQTNKLQKVVDNMMCLDSEENMQFLWQYLARLVDRILLCFHRREFISFKMNLQLGLRESLANHVEPNMTRSKLQESVFRKMEMSLKLDKASLGIFSTNPMTEGSTLTGCEFFGEITSSPT